MYCAKCGVRLADTETKCPLCQTVAYHPDIERNKAEDLYPKDKYPEKKRSARWVHIFFTLAYLIPVFTVLLSDLRENGRVEWSGIVVVSLVVAYVIFVLPTWFRNANPVIFVPSGFAAVGFLLFYINLATNGSWFLNFALPVTAALCIIATTTVTLLKYLKKGKLFVWGGAFLGLGGFVILTEFLSNIAFKIRFIGWSFYPLVTFVIVGGFLIFLGICRPARESVERRFFI